ncbi:MAG: peptidoglycan-associated lipoprotein Pal [Gammaproteobacteria bacterium]|nr:peptidoglycan-associated lipoprotein Pal [Gammaproteobacteria bacterium]
MNKPSYIFVVVLFSGLVGCGSMSSREPAPVQGGRMPIPTGKAIPIGAGVNSGISGQPLPVPVPAAQSTAGPGSAFGNIVHFDFDRSEIRPEDRATLEHHAQYMSTYRGTGMRLEGHADERGSREYNLALGERRAESVRRYLGILGARYHRMRAHSYGEEMPVDPRHNEDAWQRNRRVEMIYE